VSYAIPADEPGGVAPAALSLLVHGVLFAVLVFGLRWQSQHPEAVVAELWSELPAIEPPEPKPEIKPQPKAEPKIEQKTAKPDIAIEREKKKAKKEEPPLKFDTTQRIREQLAQEQKALQDRERKDVLKQFASPPTAGLPDAATSTRSGPRSRRTSSRRPRSRETRRRSSTSCSCPRARCSRCGSSKRAGMRSWTPPSNGLFGRAPAAEARSTRAMVARVQYQL